MRWLHRNRDMSQSGDPRDLVDMLQRSDNDYIELHHVLHQVIGIVEVYGDDYIKTLVREAAGDYI
jgi:hypothetical protein